MRYNLKCQRCDADFQAERKSARFCSVRCKQAASRVAQDVGMISFLRGRKYIDQIYPVMKADADKPKVYALLIPFRSAVEELALRFPGVTEASVWAELRASYIFSGDASEWGEYRRKNALF